MPFKPEEDFVFPVLPMAQCEAEGHTYNVVSEFETYEPITLNCLVCGAVWPISERAKRTENDLIPEVKD